MRTHQRVNTCLTTPCKFHNLTWTQGGAWQGAWLYLYTVCTIVLCIVCVCMRECVCVCACAHARTYMHLQKALDARDAVPMNCSTWAIHELSGFFCNFLSPCHETGGSCKDPPKSAMLLGMRKTFKIFTWIVLSRST